MLYRTYTATRTVTILAGFNQLGQEVLPYVPPKWIETEVHAPKYRIKLAQAPTPIHRWQPPQLRNQDVSLYIKRDDLTGAELSGNKVRKLEFLLADALMQGCDSVITCGAVQSNHCRATAIAARQLGMEPHLVLRSNEHCKTALPHEGNFLLDQVVGASATLVDRKLPYKTGLKPIMARIEQNLIQQGKHPYHIPVGGSNKIGFWGYVEGFLEIKTQAAMLSQREYETHKTKFERGILVESPSRTTSNSSGSKNITDIVLSCGSGGTASALAVSNYLCNRPFKIHAISVCDDQNYFHNHVDETLEQLGLHHQVSSRDILTVIDGFKGRGYGLTTEAELDNIQTVARETGILLDPVYTGKGFLGLMHLLNERSSSLLGNGVLFLHTGGLFGLFNETVGRHLCFQSNKNS